MWPFAKMLIILLTVSCGSKNEVQLKVTAPAEDADARIRPSIDLKKNSETTSTSGETVNDPITLAIPSEINEGTSFAVTLEKKSNLTEDIMLQWNIPSDYRAFKKQSGSITFKKGERKLSFDILSLDDRRFNGERTFTFEISGGNESDSVFLNANIKIQDVVPGRILELSAGNLGVCALAENGLFCWGDKVGQASIGMQEAAKTPVLLKNSGANVTQVSLGTHIGCYVMGGGLDCWGTYNNGLLGDGTKEPRETPVSIFPAKSGVTEVKVGINHACAIKDKKLYCWGNNRSGQLGTGDSIEFDKPTLVKDLVGDVTDVSVGQYHTCAIAGGVVYCWGENSVNQLGQGLDNTIYSQRLPLKVKGNISGITQLTSGNFHTCGIKGGKLYCWGGNYSGELGIGTRDSAAIPTLVPFDNKTVTSVSAKDAKTCAVAGSEGFCWGSGSYGTHLEKKSLDDKLSPYKVAEKEKKPTAIFPSRFVTCGVFETTKLECWGDRFIGSSEEEASIVWHEPAPMFEGETPKSVVFADITETADDSPSATCVGVDGGARCWSLFNRDGIVGDGSTDMRPNPTQVIAEGSNVTSIAIVNRTNFIGACANTNDGAQCWGNGFGTTPIDILPSGSGVTKIQGTLVGAFSDRFFCALAEGGVSCWGNNAPLGDGTIRSSPLEAVPAIAAGSGATDMAVSSLYSSVCAVVNGGVKCWGKNSSGQLGNGTLDDSLIPVDTIQEGSSVTRISSGGSDTRGAYTCAVKNGGVACWGANRSGQIGNGTTDNQLTPFMTMPEGSKVTDIVTNTITDTTCAVHDGGVSCWGWADFFLKGSAKGHEPKLKPFSVIPTGSGASKVVVTRGGGCAVAAGGLQCWGALTSFKEDIRYRDNRVVYPPNSGITDVTILGYYYPDIAICVLKDQNPYCWGSNRDGQIGNGILSRGAFRVQGF